MHSMPEISRKIWNFDLRQLLCQTADSDCEKPCNYWVFVDLEPQRIAYVLFPDFSVKNLFRWFFLTEKSDLSA